MRHPPCRTSGPATPCVAADTSARYRGRGGVRIWICLAIAVARVAGTVTLFVLGGERLQAPDLKTWTDDGGLAWDSMPLLARLRGKKADGEIF